MEPTPSPAPPVEPEKPKLVRYGLVEADTPQELVNKVAEYTRKGYVPCGGVSINVSRVEEFQSIGESKAVSFFYTQAVFLPKRRVHPLVKFWRGLGKLINALLEHDDSMPTP